MTRSSIIIIVVVAVAIAIAAFFIIRRRRYIKELEGRGWTFESSPALESVLEHTAPPFGLGFTRSVDESISGTTRSGVPFHVFEYQYREGGPKFDARLASLRLPLALPDLFVSDGSTRTGVQLAGVDIDSRWQVRAARSEYARTLLGGSVGAAISAFGGSTGRIDLSIDGAHLVAVGAPKDPDELEAFLEALAPVALAMDRASLTPFGIEAQPARFGFYGRPDWVLVDRDDSLIDKYGLTTIGTHHRTEKVVRGDNDGLPVEAFIHRWQTTRTETYTDSEGRAQTRTVTEHHDETVTAVWMPFTFPMLSLNGGWGGERVRFESEEFNDAFKVRTDAAKFASDVIHPRMMDFLMQARPPDLRIEGQVIRFSISAHDSLLIGECADFAHEFLSRVPPFVWKDLQVTPPPFRTALPSAAR